MANERYRYTTHMPPKFRCMADETPEHKFGFIQRRNILVPGANGLAYQAKCTCRWMARDFRRSKSYARTDWDKHMEAVSDQMALF